MNENMSALFLKKSSEFQVIRDAKKHKKLLSLSSKLFLKVVVLEVQKNLYLFLIFGIEIKKAIFVQPDELP